MPFSLFGPLDRLLAPPPAAGRVAFLAGTAYAHRGLHGSPAIGSGLHGGPIIENSRAAFRAAIDGGFGIELDVQAAHGGEPFVFHDATLERLTDGNGALRDRVGHELDGVRLKGTDESIPRLSEILALVDGRVPVLIEVKAKGRAIGAFCLAVRRALEGYRGPVAVMSFNPEVGHWFHAHAPRVVRGLVVTEEGKRGIRGRAERHLSLWHAKPDFLAYDIRDLPARFPALQRARGLKVLTWTVRTAAQEQVASGAADEIIFERAALAP